MNDDKSRLSLLRHRDFCVFWTGSFLSSIGTQFTTVAMAWQIYELTNSPLQIGLLGLARALPQMRCCSSAACSPTRWIGAS